MVNNEAVIGHYYRLEETTRVSQSWAEETLARIEADAVNPIRKLVEGEPLTPLERAHMALFLHVQRQRTPLARQWSAHMQERMTEILAEVNLSNPDSVRKRARALDKQMSDEEIERWRMEMLENLKSGKMVAEAGQNHEVAGIFFVADRVAPIIAERMSWCSLRAPAGASFICSDHPLHINDETVPSELGVGWISSAHTQVTMPLDQQVCRLLRPGPPTWASLAGDSETVDDINLRTYASAQWSIYGPTQQSVQRVREIAKHDRARVRAYAPRPPRFVLFESTEGEPQPRSVEAYRPPAERPRRRPKR